MAFRSVARSYRPALVPLSQCVRAPYYPTTCISSCISRVQPMSTQKYDLHSAKVQNATPLNDADAKWLGLRTIQWVDPAGKERFWDCAVRKTRKGDVDGAYICALTQRWQSSPSSAGRTKCRTSCSYRSSAHLWAK